MRRRPPTRKRSGGLLALPFLLVPVALAAAGLIALIAVSTDVSEALGIPPSVNEYLQRDHVAYPAHATLGQVFQRLGRPSMAALQWLKAASHARSAEDVERAARGIAAALERDGDGARVRATLCPLVRGGLGAREAAAVSGGGLDC